MKKKIVKFAIPILLATVATTSYAISKNNLFPNSNTYTIESKVNEVENTIAMSQVRSLETLEGVSNLFYYDGENTIAFGMNPELDKVEEWSEDKDQDYTSYCRTLYGDVYTTDINAIDPMAIKVDQIPLNSLDTEFGAGYSPNGKYIDYIQKEESFIYDVENNKAIQYEDFDLIGNWSEDSKYMIKYGVVEEEDMSIRKFILFDKQGNLVRSTPIDEKVNYVRISSHFYSENGDEVYFAGRVYEGGTLQNGVFKINTQTGSIENIISFKHSQIVKIDNPGTDLKEHPGKTIDIYLDSRVYDYELMSNGDILLNAMIENKQGLYLYNTEENSPKLFLELESGSGVGFELAPDQSKIIFTINKSTPNDENESNIYVANIDHEGLSNITYVKKNTFGHSFKWSNDSKNVVFLEPESKTITLVKFK